MSFFITYTDARAYIYTYMHAHTLVNVFENVSERPPFFIVHDRSFFFYEHFIFIQLNLIRSRIPPKARDQIYI